MYLKNIILLICVTLYISQCLGTRISNDQREIISYIVEKYANPNGIDNEENGDLNLIGVKEVIDDVEVQLQINKPLSSVEELKVLLSSYLFTFDDVKKYFAEYTGQVLKPGRSLTRITDLFNWYGNTNGINFQVLKTLLGELSPGTKYIKAGGFPYLQFPKTAIPYKTEISINKFANEEVEFIVVDYFFSK
ncbi:uncharacterized protein LOC126837320 [Adelges cooleyi]|uniref:uncharacterized protein LOC126837320 n=1 Tax=Adelges cooleyi TaxID=133065 RepID=UPI00217F2A36|nr:uncharacterized protein LOC126837320 [Adelges cooleyi]XP_050427137.1 uncharacterized protein LOC126837320 [Adelges cooleyi]